MTPHERNLSNALTEAASIVARNADVVSCHTAYLRVALAAEALLAGPRRRERRKVLSIVDLDAWRAPVAAGAANSNGGVG